MSCNTLITGMHRLSLGRHVTPVTWSLSIHLQRRHNSATAIDKQEMYEQNKKINYLRRLARISRPPPRKVSGWTIFVQEYLYQLRVRGIKPDITGISPTISKKWRALSPAEKQVYIDKAKERKEELNDAYNVWFKSLTPEQLVIYYRIVTLRRELLSSEASSTTKKAVLKRPPTSFLRFFADMRKSRLQDLPILDQAREAARLWAELPEAEKEVYQTISKQEMEEYKKKKMEMYQYKELNLIRQQLTKDLKVFAGRK